MKAKLQAKLAKAFSGSLSDAVKQFTYTITSDGAVNPTTGVRDGTAVSGSGRGVFNPVSLKEADGQSVLIGDIELIYLVIELVDSSAAVIASEVDGAVTVGSKTYLIINSVNDPTDSVCTVLLRG